MSEKENQEFTLEDILREFGDGEQQIPERTADEILEKLEEEVREELHPAPEEPEEPEAPEGAAVDLSDTVTFDKSDTVTFEKIENAQGQVRIAQPIEEEDLQPEPPVQEQTAEPYSEEWEPDYEQPIGNYEPARLIPFQPRSRLRELKKKLVEGPEKMYYALLEKGLGKLQLAIFFSVVLVLISGVATALYALGAVPENRMKLMVFWQFFAMLAAALLGSGQLVEGIADVFRKRFSLNSLLVFTFILCCADGVLCLGQQRVPCCAAFGLQMVMSLWNTYEERNTRLGQLDTMRKATRLDSLTAVEDYHEEEKGFIRAEGQVEDFTETLDSPCGPEKALNVYALVALILSVVSGVAAGVLHGWETGIQVAAVTGLAAVPASMFVSVSRPMAVLERRLHGLGTVLCGWQGVKALCGKALFPVDHGDLFPVGTVKMNGVKFYGKRDTDQILAYAATLINAGGGSLAVLFEHLLDSRNGRHYSVEDFRVYAEGGVGGLVCGEPVLAGSIDFLKTMGVEVPQGIRLDQAVCVAVDGELCGLFAVAYEKTRDGAAGMRTLTGYRGLRAAIVTDDFMFTEAFIKEQFDIKTKKLCFPPVEARMALREKTPGEDAMPHILVTGEGLAPFAYGVTGARTLRNAAVTGVTVHIVGGAIGIAMMLVLGILGATELLTPAAMFLYELVWMVPGLLITEWTRSI